MLTQGNNRVVLQNKGMPVDVVAGRVLCCPAVGRSLCPLRPPRRGRLPDSRAASQCHPRRGDAAGHCRSFRTPRWLHARCGRPHRSALGSVSLGRARREGANDQPPAAPTALVAPSGGSASRRLPVPCLLRRSPLTRKTHPGSAGPPSDPCGACLPRRKRRSTRSVVGTGTIPRGRPFEEFAAAAPMRGKGPLCSRWWGA